MPKHGKYHGGKMTSNNSKIHGYNGEHVNQDYEEKKTSGVFRIPSDNNAVALMPQEVVYQHVNSPYSSLPDVYMDTIEGADRQINEDLSQLHKGFKPTKV